MKIGLIVDNRSVTRWQALALQELRGCSELIVYNCTNPSPSKKRLRHLFYYALNLFTIRNVFTQSVELPEQLPIAAVTDFAAEADGIWQRLPDLLVEQILADRPQVILKFGMGLLRIPPSLAVPILSYHHGDPEQFRGRPAGFYELLHGRPSMGQIIQILSNKLDAGAVVAFGETKVHAHSYKATLKEAYRHSRYLINEAVGNAVRGTPLAKAVGGKVYRLPGNLTVLKFLGQRMAAAVRRLAYGMFMEKGWSVALAKVDGQTFLDLRGAALHSPEDWTPVDCPPGYAFLADPFHNPAGPGLLVEALGKASNKGEILLIDEKRWTRLSSPNQHHSYPCTIEEGGRNFVIPEMADWSDNKIFHLGEGGQWEEVGSLEVPGRPRLFDPTLCRTSEGVFLFGNVDVEGSSVLRLWHSDSLFEPFSEHPLSPIRVSPAGARMAGSIFSTGGGCYRPGQDFRGQYGNGIIIFSIEALSREEYREKELFAFQLNDRKGPHTLNFKNGQAVFDWYRDRFSFLAGLRRLRQARPPSPTA